MFTDPWPAGYDGIFFSNVFHDWDRASCLHLAKRSYAALPPGGRIFLHEVVLNDTKDGPLVAAAFSMEMLALRGKPTRRCGWRRRAISARSAASRKK